MGVEGSPRPLQAACMGLRASRLPVGLWEEGRTRRAGSSASVREYIQGAALTTPP